jgi:hypothetical protein
MPGTVDQPGAHLLVVGVSAYPHLEGGSGTRARETFGKQQLSTAASTAYRVFEFLTTSAQFTVPLASARLLLSPSERELAGNPALADAEPATLDAFLAQAEAWRRDVAAHPDGFALMYLVGHGIQRTQADQVFLLEDFGDGVGPLFRKAIELSSVIGGLAPAPWQPSVARRQLYMYDAGRGEIPRTLELPPLAATPVFDVHRAALDDRSVVTLFSAQPGGMAIGEIGRGTLFGQAFVRSVDKGLAATPVDDGEEIRWVVTTGSLTRAIEAEMHRLAASYDLEATLEVGGSVGDIELFRLHGPPEVEVDVEFLGRRPGATVHVELMGVEDEVVFSGEVKVKDGLHAEIPAGMYRLGFRDATAPSGSPLRFDRWRLASAPSSRWTTRLES